MASIKLATGQDVKELRIWDGTKWVGKTGRIYTNKWIDFIRPELSFKDDFITLKGMVRQSVSDNSGVIQDGKFAFDTLIRYEVY